MATGDPVSFQGSVPGNGQSAQKVVVPERALQALADAQNKIKELLSIAHGDTRAMASAFAAQSALITLAIRAENGESIPQSAIDSINNDLSAGEAGVSSAVSADMGGGGPHAAWPDYGVLHRIHTLSQPISERNIHEFGKTLLSGMDLTAKERVDMERNWEKAMHIPQGIADRAAWNALHPETRTAIITADEDQQHTLKKAEADPHLTPEEQANAGAMEKLHLSRVDGGETTAELAKNKLAAVGAAKTRVDQLVDKRYDHAVPYLEVTLSGFAPAERALLDQHATKDAQGQPSYRNIFHHATDLARHQSYWNQLRAIEAHAEKDPQYKASLKGPILYDLLSVKLMAQANVNTALTEYDILGQKLEKLQALQPQQLSTAQTTRLGQLHDLADPNTSDFLRANILAEQLMQKYPDLYTKRSDTVDLAMRMIKGMDANPAAARAPLGSAEHKALVATISGDYTYDLGHRVHTAELLLSGFDDAVAHGEGGKALHYADQGFKALLHNATGINSAAINKTVNTVENGVGTILHKDWAVVKLGAAMTGDLATLNFTQYKKDAHTTLTAIARNGEEAWNGVASLWKDKKPESPSHPPTHPVKATVHQQACDAAKGLHDVHCAADPKQVPTAPNPVIAVKKDEHAKVAAHT